jgi:hypothetical protein
MINKVDHTTPRKVTQKASLSGVVDEENLMEVFGIVVRKSYWRPTAFVDTSIMPLEAFPRQIHTRIRRV